MNIYDYVVPKNGEIITTLFEHKNIKINRIVSSATFESMEYIQNEDEWVFVVKGKATLLVQKNKIILTMGESLFIPAFTPHRVLNTQHDTLWIAIHIT